VFEELDGEDLLWKLVGAGAALAAAAATRAVVRGLWRSAKNAEPPEDPASPAVSWGDALAWAALTGVAVGVAEMVAKRVTASGWEQATGGLPPSLASEDR
jgi:hypothetical protein